MRNGISKTTRIERTLAGIFNQLEDFTFIIEEYVSKLSEEELIWLYKLKEDI